MYVFIDTVNWLDFYDLSSAGLAELERVQALIDGGQITLVLPKQVKDEFFRGRQDVIARSLKVIAPAVKIEVPNLFAGYEERDELLSLVRLAEEGRKKLIARAKGDITGSELPADKVIRDLFDRGTDLDVDYAAAVARARLRTTVGNPPGKSGGRSIGDAVNWESLLLGVPPDGQLHLISRDGDFVSPLDSSLPKEFLAREWDASKDGAFHTYRSIDAFIKRNYPEVWTADDPAKHLAVSAFAQSPSYRDTHEAVKRLQKYDAFSQADIGTLLAALRTNGQIYRIIDDPDVAAFAWKLLDLADSDLHGDAMSDLKELLTEPHDDEEESDELAWLDELFPDLDTSLPDGEELDFGGNRSDGDEFPPEEDLPF